jgi:hypothetical protein
MITFAWIVVYLIGFGIVWKLDDGSYTGAPILKNSVENLRKRLILSLFSWVIALPFFIIYLIAGIIDKDNL